MAPMAPMPQILGHWARAPALSASAERRALPPRIALAAHAAAQGAVRLE